MKELDIQEVEMVSGGVVLAAIATGLVIIYALDQAGVIDVF